MTWEVWGCVLVWFVLIALSLGAGWTALWGAGAILLGAGLAWFCHPDRRWNQVPQE